MSDNTEINLATESVRMEDADKEELPVEETPSDGKEKDDAALASSEQEDTSAEANEEMDTSPPSAEQEKMPSSEEIIAELEDKYRRALAETHNVRRRAEEERRNAMRFGISAFARDMLSVCDNLGRALDAAEREKSDEEDKPKTLRDLMDGIQVIQRELHDVMGRHGIKQMEPLGERFDPNYHEAVFEAGKESEHEFDVIVEVAQSGYLIGERLLRPAKVGIARAKSKASPVAFDSEVSQPETRASEADLQPEDEGSVRAKNDQAETPQ